MAAPLTTDVAVTYLSPTVRSKSRTVKARRVETRYATDRSATDIVASATALARQPTVRTDCRFRHHWSTSASCTIQSPGRSGWEVMARTSRAVTAWTITSTGRLA